jgi:hypothetical protein
VKVAAVPFNLHLWSIEEMATADGLANVEERELSSVVTTTGADFVGRLATVSAYRKLAQPQRADALSEARAMLPDRVDIDTTAQLAVARSPSELGHQRGARRRWAPRSFLLAPLPQRGECKLNRPAPNRSSPLAGDPSRARAGAQCCAHSLCTGQFC